MSVCVCRLVRLVCWYVGMSVRRYECTSICQSHSGHLFIGNGKHVTIQDVLVIGIIVIFERNTKMMMEPPERRFAATPGTGGGGGGSFSSTTYVRRRASGGGAALRRLNRASKKMALAGKRRVSSVIRIYSYLEWNDANKCSTS